MLLDKQIARLKPGTHADKNGLYLRVRESGKKSWVLRSQAGGVDTWKTLGRYPALSLADARRLSEGRQAEVTMAAAVDKYKSKISVRRPEQVARLLEPLLQLELNVSRVELVRVLQEKAATAPTQANRMLTRWKDFFNFCEQHGWIDRNPIMSVQRKFVGGKEKSRDRVLSWGEIEDFLRLVLTPDTKLALYTILATGLRPSEALWVMRTRRLIAVPTKEHPDPAIHNVPAVPHVKAILKLTYKVPKSHLTLSNALRRKKCGYTPHDLRRTFATRMADLGVAPHIIEKMLDHTMQGMMAIYNHAEYRQERIDAMKLWGHKLSSLRRSARASRV